MSQSSPGDSSKNLPPPPETWKSLLRFLDFAKAPVERFLAIEASSGILLLLTAAIALIWVNSAWSESYVSLWHTPLSFRLGDWSFERDLHFWINDGLMTIFFFVVGLEIKREMHKGELSEVRRAVLPIIAAIGGMVVPALIYLGFNRGLDSATGWGVPMATDIAFAVGVIALLGKRVSPALRILLLTLAVIDDIGAILVIAIFYSSEISLMGFGVAGFGLLSIFFMQKIGIRSPWAYLIPALIAWAGTYKAGIHPTIAGVIIGLMTPVRPWLKSEEFSEVLEKAINKVDKTKDGNDPSTYKGLANVGVVRKEVLSPVDRLQHQFHGWVAFGIMPLFALANAGIPLGSTEIEGSGMMVFLGVSLGLVLGKPLGIFLFSWIAVKLNLASLPTGVRWSGITVVGLCAGIGFTMAFFVSQLAFVPGPLLETSKLAVLSASVIAAVLAFVYGLIVLKPIAIPGAALTESEAESATHL